MEQVFKEHRPVQAAWTLGSVFRFLCQQRCVARATHSRQEKCKFA